MVSVKHIYQEKNIIWLSTFATEALARVFKCEQCDHEATQKQLLRTHKYVGSRFKCNQCGQIAIQ